jgi:hypothetical protein
VIEIGIGQKNAGDRAVARRTAPRLQFGRAFDLSGQVRRSVNQEPASIVAADRDARLRLRCNFAGARRQTIGTGAIPLRQAATRRAPENPEANRLHPLDQIAPA